MLQYLLLISQKFLVSFNMVIVVFVEALRAFLIQKLSICFLGEVSVGLEGVLLRFLLLEFSLDLLEFLFALFSILFSL